MSDDAPVDGSLDVSPEVHDFMNSLEYNSKISEGTKLALFKEQRKNDIFQFGFAVGYSKKLDLLFLKSQDRKTVAPRGFPYDAYRTILQEEAIERKMSIGGLVSAYADAGLLHLKQELEAGKDLMEIMGF